MGKPRIRLVASFSITLATLLAVVSGPAANAALLVTQVVPGSDITSLALAQAALSNAEASTTWRRAYDTLNFSDFGSQTTFNFFPNTVPWPALDEFGIGDPLNSNFASLATGQFFVPRAGSWTFFLNNDDGTRVTVNGEPIITWDVGRGSTGLFATRTLTQGWHNLEVLHYEHLGEAYLELAAAEGSVPSVFNAEIFRLLGDVANGGLETRYFPVGDFNRDQYVDAADYTVWRDKFGLIVAPYTGADSNGDGFVQFADYEAWKNAFASSVTEMSGSAVPEPTTSALLFTALSAAACSRSSRLAFSTEVVGR